MTTKTKVKRRSSAEVKASLEVAKKGKENSKLIRPAIRINNADNALETLYKKGAFPKMRAVGIARLEDHKNSWVSYTATIIGDKVVDIEVGEPNLKLIAIDEAKVGFVTNFMDTEETL